MNKKLTKTEEEEQRGRKATTIFRGFGMIEKQRRRWPRRLNSSAPLPYDPTIVDDPGLAVVRKLTQLKRDRKNELSPGTVKAETTNSRRRRDLTINTMAVLNQ